MAHITIKTARERLADFNKTPESYALDLKVAFSGVMIEAMTRQKLTFDEMQKRTGLNAQQIKRLIHATGNPSVKTLGVVLHALKARARVVKVEENS